MSNGNAKNIIGQWASFSGKLGQLLWPTLKPAVEKGEINLANLSKDDEMRKAIRRGFLRKLNRKFDLGLDIGKVSKRELADLSVWDLKRLYDLFYQQTFGLYLTFPDELMPEGSNEFAWPVCVSGIISNEVAFQSGKLNLPRWKFTDKSLDAVLNLSRGRDVWTHSFIVRVRPNWEADEDLKNLSGNAIEAKGTDVLMLRERSILGWFIYWLTGEHLDRQTVTLTGSRYSDGRVPDMGFGPDSGRVGVDWCSPGSASPNLRSRQKSPKKEIPIVSGFLDEKIILL